MNWAALAKSLRSGQEMAGDLSKTARESRLMDQKRTDDMAAKDEERKKEERVMGSYGRLAEALRGGATPQEASALAFEGGLGNIGLPLSQQGYADQSAAVARKEKEQSKAQSKKDEAERQAKEFAASKAGFNALMARIGSAVTDQNDKKVLQGIMERAETSARSKDDFAKLTQEALDIYATGRSRMFQEEKETKKDEKEKTKRQEKEDKEKAGFLSSVDILLSQSKKAPAKGEGGFGRLSGTATKLAGKAGFASEYELLDSYSRALAGPAARTIMQEKGNMAEGDVARMLAMFPKATDTRKERSHKEMVLRSLSDVISGKMDPEGFKDLLYKDVPAGDEPETTQSNTTKTGKSFKTVEDAEAAGLAPGTIVFINGRKAVIE